MSITSAISALIVILLFTYSCSSIIPGKTSNQSKTYTEDISPYRAKIPSDEPLPAAMISFTATADSISSEVSEKLNTVLDTAASYARATIPYIDGFTIQIYGGDNRTLARDYRLDLLRSFPQTEPQLVFEQPNYKVRVGQYYTRLEAQHFFSEVKDEFPKAILIPTRIYIK